MEPGHKFRGVAGKDATILHYPLDNYKGDYA